MMPVAHAMSRAHERSADRFALDLTKNPGAFISAMRRLGAQNLAEENPSKLVQWLFYSHPPIRERIAAAQEVRITTFAEATVLKPSLPLRRREAGDHVRNWTINAEHAGIEASQLSKLFAPSRSRSR